MYQLFCLGMKPIIFITIEDIPFHTLQFLGNCTECVTFMCDCKVIIHFSADESGKSSCLNSGKNCVLSPLGKKDLNGLGRMLRLEVALVHNWAPQHEDISCS